MAVPAGQQADGNVQLSRDAREVCDIVHRVANGVQEPQTVVAERRIVRIDRHACRKTHRPERVSAESARMASSNFSRLHVFARLLRSLADRGQQKLLLGLATLLQRGRIRRLVIGAAVLLFLDAQDIGRTAIAGEKVGAVFGVEEPAERLDAAERSSGDRPGPASANTASIRSCRAPWSRR